MKGVTVLGALLAAAALLVAACASASAPEHTQDSIPRPTMDRGNELPPASLPADQDGDPSTIDLGPPPSDTEDRVDAETAARFAAENRAAFEAIPVPLKATAVIRTENDCTGTYNHDASSSCFLTAYYEMTSPLEDAMAELDAHLESEGWEVSSDDPVYRTYMRDLLMVQFSPSYGVDASSRCDALGLASPESCLAHEKSADDGLSRKLQISIHLFAQ
jgi:hypothetical protein